MFSYTNLAFQGIQSNTKLSQSNRNETSNMLSYTTELPEII